MAFLCLSAMAAVAEPSSLKLTPAPRPSEPLIAKVPEGASWLIKYASGPEGLNKSDKKTPDLIQNRYANGILQEETKNTDGTSTWRYIFRGTVAFPTSTQEIAIESLSHVYEGSRFRPDEFNDFQWIKSDLFIGDAVYQEIPCHVYRESMSSNSMPRTAFINKTTRLPVAIEDSLSKQIYTFQGTKAQVDLPAIVLKAIEKRMAAVKKYYDKYNIPQ